jgi:hypothetical protein
MLCVLHGLILKALTAVLLFLQAEYAHMLAAQQQQANQHYYDPNGAALQGKPDSLSIDASLATHTER